MLVHGQLVNINREVIDPLQHVAAFLIKDYEIAHLVAGVNLVTIGRETKRHDVCPLIDILTVRCQALDSVQRRLSRHGAFVFDLTWHGHVVVKITAGKVSHQDSAF